jgi:hypothetical protein
MRWIPVDERRPTHSRSVLCRVQSAGRDGFTIQVVSYINLLGAWVQFDSNEPARGSEQITHWMEMPYPMPAHAPRDDDAPAVDRDVAHASHG